MHRKSAVFSISVYQRICAQYAEHLIQLPWIDRDCFQRLSQMRRASRDHLQWDDVGCEKCAEPEQFNGCLTLLAHLLESQCKRDADRFWMRSRNRSSPLQQCFLLSLLPEEICIVRQTAS